MDAPNSAKNQKAPSKRVQELFSLITKYHNPVDVSLSPRRPDTLGFLPKDARNNIESNIRKEISKALSGKPKMEWKLSISQEVADQIYYSAMDNEFLSELAHKSDENSKKIMDMLNNSILEYTSSIDQDDFKEALSEEIFSAMVNGNMEFVSRFIPKEILFQMLGSIVMLEMNKMEDHDLNIVKSIFNHANAFIEYRNQYNQQQDELKRAQKSKGKRQEPAKGEMTKEMVNEKHKEISKLIKMEYDKLLSEQTVHAPLPKKNQAKTSTKK